MHRESKIQYPPFYKATPIKGQTRFLMQGDSKILPNCSSQERSPLSQGYFFIAEELVYKKGTTILLNYTPQEATCLIRPLFHWGWGALRGRLRFRRCMQAANISLFVFLSLIDICTWQLFLYKEESWNNSSPYFLSLYI